MIELLLLYDIHLNPALIERAWQEPAFEQALISETNKTLSLALNVKIPVDIQYHILKDTPELYHLVLPFVPANATAAERQEIYKKTVMGYDPSYEEELLQLLVRIDADVDLRQALLAQPETTLAAELQFSIPEGIRFQVIENTQSQRYLVLPLAQDEETDELQESELSLLAGGLSSFVAECGNPNLRYRNATVRC